MQRAKVAFINDSENAVCVLVSSLQGHNKCSVFILLVLVFKKFASLQEILEL